MRSRLLVAVVAVFLPVLGMAQVQPAGNRFPLNLSIGAGMDYWSGDWGAANIHRWGPAAWATVSIWRGLGVNAEGHSMNVGGNNFASSYKYYVAEGGPIYVFHHWNRIEPYAKAELGFASLTHPSNFSGHLHDTSNTWAIGGGIEYHTWGPMWTRVDYTYDAFPNFHSSITGQNHILNPQGIAFGESFRFGQQSSRF